MWPTFDVATSFSRKSNGVGWMAKTSKQEILTKVWIRKFGLAIVSVDVKDSLVVGQKEVVYI